MSRQTMADAWAPIHADHRDNMMAMTWGHLAPRKNKTYRGHIVFAVGCFGADTVNPTALECEFNGIDSSPWFYDAMVEFIAEYGGDDSAGHVYRFDGTFRNYEFRGEIKRLSLAVQP